MQGVNDLPERSGHTWAKAGAEAAIAYVLIFASTAIAVITPLMVFLGPKPGPSQNPALLPRGQELAIVEPVDQTIVVFWWLLALAGAVLIARSATRSLGFGSQKRSRARTAIVIVCAFDVAALVLSVSWGSDPIGLWSGLPGSGLLAGIGITLAFAFLWFARRTALTRAAEVLAAGVLLIWSVPNLVQLPWTVRDFTHFRFVADEIAAQAVGKVSFSNYVPTYESLLGLPLAPLLRFLGDGAAAGIVGYLNFLTLLIIAIGIAIPVLIAGRRMLLPSAVVVLGAVLAQTTNGLSSATYSPVSPVRLVLPVVTIATALFVLVPREAGFLAHRRRIWLLLVGVLAGAALINNLDFGLPALGAVCLAVIAASMGWRLCVETLAFIGLGVLTAGALYTVGAALYGSPIDWQLATIFPNFHGLAGFFAFPIASMGPHIAVATLFVTAASIGVGMSWLQRDSVSVSTRRLWMWVSLTGLWGLLSLIYFSGRSYSSTLLAGSAFTLGICIAALLPAIRYSLRRALHESDKGPSLSTVPAAFAMAAIILTTGLWVTVDRPSTYIAPNLTSVWSLKGPMADIEADVENRLAGASYQVKGLVEAGRVSQFLWNSNLIALAYPNLPTWGVGNSPQWMTLSRQFLDRQCAQMLPAGADYVWLTREEWTSMNDSSICRQRFNLESAIEFFPDSPDMLVGPRASTAP